jgi:hypothetical protein
MNRSCFRVEELEAISALPSGDPGLGHLGECPRCRALLAAYREFVEPSVVPPPENLADARARLSAALGRETREETPKRSFTWSLKPMMQPAWRPALAVVGMLTIVLLLTRHEPFRRESHGITVRGVGTESAAPLVLGPVATAPGGGIRLSWQRLEGADSYEVALFTAELEEIARVAAGAAAEVILDARAIPDSLRAGTSIVCRILARRGGDEIARSKAQSLVLPPRR